MLQLPRFLIITGKMLLLVSANWLPSMQSDLDVPFLVKVGFIGKCCPVLQFEIFVVVLIQLAEDLSSLVYIMVCCWKEALLSHMIILNIILINIIY